MFVLRSAGSLQGGARTSKIVHFHLDVASGWCHPGRLLLVSLSVKRLKRNRAANPLRDEREILRRQAECVSGISTCCLLSADRDGSRGWVLE